MQYENMKKMKDMMYNQLSVLSALICLFSCAVLSASENGCVKCHKQFVEQEQAQPSHSFAEWEKSLHARMNVSCDLCHGGQLSAKDKESAHSGIYRSSDPESPIYFNRIPDFCGTCHVKELNGFKKSIHYEELRRSGKGPNCVTCHGSMATHILSPREMESICTLCHRQPTQAYASLMSLKMSKKLLDQLQNRILELKGQRADILGQAESLEKSKRSYQEALQLWHSFDMSKVAVHAQNLNQQIRNALHELKLKNAGESGSQGEKTKKDK